MKIILIAILAVLVIILGAFYWYEYRPSQIRKECNKLSPSFTGKTFTISESPTLFSEKIYQSCLRDHGLEK